MTLPANASLAGARALRVFACFALGYLLSYGLRSINAVIAPSLTSELGLSNSDLGMLSSAYFIAFGCMQLPLGVWLDRYGSRRTEAALLLCAALGAAVFASSDSLAGLWIGRALIGAGVSACLMAAFKAYRQWYAPEQQSQLASWMLVAGTSGALVATLPVTMALPHIGWRGVFWIVAALLVLVAAALFFLLRDVERDFPAARGDSGGGGYRRIFGSGYFWRLGVAGLLIHGIFFALQTLWAGPWMITVLGKTQAETGQILFYFNLVLLLSYVALGWCAPRIVRRGWNLHVVIGAGLSGMVIMLALILFTTSSRGWLLWLPLAICVPLTTLLQSQAGLAFPASMAGRANTAYNMMLFIGAFAAQWGFGLVIDLAARAGATQLQAFRSALAVALALQAVALAYFVFSRAQPAQGA
ncbi:MAG: MFS transporter [Pseudomonadota bacterium]